jgi:ComF family protein
MILQLFRDVQQLFYPNICCGCGRALPQSILNLCIQCQYDLPYTNFILQRGNPVEKIFAGRIPVYFAHSTFYFSQKGIIQQLIHHLKYKNNTDIGIYLGKKLGESLLLSPYTSTFDFIVPMPMHPKKKFIRGYNQAEIISTGIGEVTGVPVLNQTVIRKQFSGTQTKKKRIERWLNVENSFEVKEPEVIYNKKVLLVDDVITTGASMEACGKSILEVQGTEIALASVAYTSK